MTEAAARESGEQPMSGLSESERESLRTALWNLYREAGVGGAVDPRPTPGPGALQALDRRIDALAPIVERIVAARVGEVVERASESGASIPPPPDPPGCVVPECPTLAHVCAAHVKLNWSLIGVTYCPDNKGAADELDDWIERIVATRVDQAWADGYNAAVTAIPNPPTEATS